MRCAPLLAMKWSSSRWIYPRRLVPNESHLLGPAKNALNPRLPRLKARGCVTQARRCVAHAIRFHVEIGPE
jgi:hypothetical protein